MLPLDSFTAFIQKFPILFIPLLALALYFIFQVVKKLVIRLVAMGIVALALYVGYTLYLSPKIPKVHVDAFKEKVQETAKGLRQVADQAKEVKRDLETLNRKREEAMELLGSNDSVKK